MDLGQLEYDVAVDTSGLDKAERKMDDFADSARRGAAEIDKYGNALTSADKKAGRFVDATGRMREANGRLVKGMNEASTSAKKATASIDKVRSAVQLLAGSLAVREIIRYSDAWNNAANQLRQVTETTEQLIGMQQRLMTVANETRTSFTSTANLYSRLARSTTEMALSSSDLVAITRTINQSFAVSGATAEEASAAITQLSQGLAAGALRGDEFNSVAEQAPGILRAVAASVGMNIGEIREFAATGGITAEIVVNALQGAADTIGGEFSRSVATFGQQMTIAKNNMQQLVGESDQLQDAIRSLGDGVVSSTGFIRDNSEAIFTAASAAIAGGAAYSVYRTSLWLAVAAQKAFNVAAMANPIGIIITALGAAVGAYYALRNATIELQDTTASVTQWIQGAWTAVANLFSSAFGEAISTVDGYFDRLGVSVGEVTSYLSESFASAMESIASIGKSAINGVIAYFLTLRDAVGIVASSIASQFGEAFDRALNMGRAFWEDLTGIFEGDFSLDALEGALADGLVNPLSGVGSELAAAFEKNFSQDFVGGAIDYTIGAVEGFAADVSSATQRIAAESAEAVTSETIPSIDGVKKAVTEATDATKKLKREMDSLIDTIYPLKAAQRDYARQVELLEKYAEKNGWSQEKLKDALERLKKEYQNAGDAADVYGLKGVKAAKSVEDATGPMVDTFKRGIERMDDAGVDMWRGFLDGTNDAMESFEDIVLDMLAEVAHNMTTRQLIVPIQAAITGSSTTGTGTTGGAMSMDTLISGGESAYNQFTGTSTTGIGSYTQAAGNAWRAYQGVGSTYSGAFGSELVATGNGGVGAANASLASGAASGLYTAGAGYAGSYVGTELGSSLTGKTANSNYGATIGTAAGAYIGSIVPVIGTAIGAAIGGAIGGFADSAFGSGREYEFKFGQESEDPALTGQELSGDTSGGDGTPWYSSGDYNEGDLGRGRTTAFGSFGFLSKEMVEPDDMIDFLNSLEEIDNAIAAAMDDDQIERIKTSLDGYRYKGDSMADVMEDRLDVIIDESDSVFEEAIQGLGGDIDRQIQGLIGGLQIEKIGGEMADAVAEEMNSRFLSVLEGGSVEAIQAATESILAAAQAVVFMGDSAEGLNLQFDDTAVASLDAATHLATLAGGLDNLSAMQDAYYQAFYTAEEQFSAFSSGLENQFEELGVTLPKTREGVRDLVEGFDLMTESGREQYSIIMQLIPALEEYIDGMDLLGQRAVLQQRALGEVQSAYEDLQSSVESQQEALQASLERQQESLQASFEATMEGLQNSLSDAESEVSRLSNVFDALGSAIDSTRVESEALTKQRREEAQGFLLSQLAAGRVTDPDALNDALSVVSEPSEDMFSTLADFTHDQLVTQNVIKAVQDNTGDNLTAAEQTVVELQAQVEAEEIMHEQTLERLDAQTELAIAQLDAQFEAATAQLEAELGSQSWLQTINSSVLSMSDALAELDVAMATAGGGTSSGGLLSGVGSIESIYQDVLGRSTDAEGLAFYTGALSAGTHSLDEIRDEIANSPEARGVPGYANGGSFGGGLRMVGERGPELEFTGPSRIMSNGDVRGMLDNTELTQEVKALRQDLKFTQGRLVELSSKTQRSVETIEYEGVFIRDEETA